MGPSPIHPDGPRYPIPPSHHQGPLPMGSAIQMPPTSTLSPYWNPQGPLHTYPDPATVMDSPIRPPNTLNYGPEPRNNVAPSMFSSPPPPLPPGPPREFEDRLRRLEQVQERVNRLEQVQNRVDRLENAVRHLNIDTDTGGRGRPAPALMRAGRATGGDGGSRSVSQASSDRRGRPQ